MKVLIINGPNLNLLGIREKEIYGSESYDALVKKLFAWAEEEKMEIDCFQSNHEGELVDRIQKAYFEKYDGIIINPAAYTHTSIAILDALKAVEIPAVEVHISKISERENYRAVSYVREYCFMTVSGHGIEGYHIALLAMKKKIMGVM